jgi:hypothetical protein
MSLKQEEKQNPGKIKTFSGKWIDPYNPEISNFYIEDIAHGLSMICRFNGHSNRFYSVLEHSLRGACMVSEKNITAFLLHDASEAYIMDVPRPLKGRMIGYYELEDTIMSIISKKFEFKYPLADEIKEIDNRLLSIEWDEFMTKRLNYKYQLVESKEPNREIMKNTFIELLQNPSINMVKAAERYLKSYSLHWSIEKNIK